MDGHCVQRSRPRYAAPSKSPFLPVLILPSPAQNFYSTVFKCTFKAPESKDKDANGNVELAKFDFNPDVTLSGSVRRVPEKTGVLSPGRGGICLYWLVEDVEKIGEIIEKAGGKMLSDPVKEGEYGLYRFFEDTDGNLGAVY